MNTLQVSPNILQWAADYCGLSVYELIDLLKAPASKHEALMSGNLTIGQIEKLAKKTQLPFGYFFLDTPPQINLNRIPDLRQLPEAIPLSNNFFDTLDDILHKQQWYLDYIKEHGINKLDFVGKFDSSISIEIIASDIRNTLNLTMQEQKKCTKFEDFYRLFSNKAEDIGVLVFKNSIVKNNTRRSLSVNEFRGFAIADNYAPLIFINGKDFPAAWIFTLAHELVHIWLGKSGISNISDEQIDLNNKLEKYCNQVAAELLIPKKLFLDAWEKHPEIEVLSKEFTVSKQMIARRAYSFNKISRKDYINATQVKKNMNLTKKSDNNHSDPYRSYPIRNSKRVTNAIINTAMSGDMMLREAASLLNIKPHTIIELSKRRVN